MKRILLAAGLVLLPAAAFAQSGSDAGYGPAQGEWEATLSGAGTSNNDFNNHNLGASGSAGYYMTDNVLVGARQSVGFSDVDNGDNQWTGSTRGFADYVFDFGRFRPYVGVSAGGIYGDGINDTFVAGPEIGAKYYADRNTFVFAQTEYQFTFDNIEDADNSSSDGIFQHAIGVGFNF